ncbi:hypothetical protein AG1IA_03313 [Rhizoctonia solani AG-1 IA]|uniref:Uncharacterized protein n=1 Tax=Thanatephorus cucumeris (strain AG1-IA) TaxID=983506 RepID=L8X0N3_THACA|nr:hypothetical protein AG1IA_03313 [Rhizoctonia solani AG-1 IA]
MAESRIFKRIGKVLMRSYKLRMPGNLDLPVRVRPCFVALTFVIMLLLSLLGFTDLAHEIINDKLEHFLALGTATALFYLIFDVEDKWSALDHKIRSDRVFRTKHSKQATLWPTCWDQLWDCTVSTLVPSIVATYSHIVTAVAYMIERHHRHRREIARLYQPLNAGEPSPTSSEEDLSLPLHANPSKSNTKPKGGARVGNVWDHHSREELFGIGEDDMSDNENGNRR